MPANPIRLANPVYDLPEIQVALNVLRSGNVTQGDLVRAFEQAVHAYLQAPDTHAAAMVNSGSSANLLAATLLAHQAEKSRTRRREIIMPALTWSTTVAPFIQHGFKPVFVDVGPDYCIDPAAVQEAITPNTLAIVAVHLLGNPCNMTALQELCHDRDLHLVEDSCEALGAKWRDQCVGTFGGISTYSFYLSHHLNTIEGGLLLYPRKHHEVLAFREHGWIRNYPPQIQAKLAEDHPDLHPTWTFDQLGYNVRSTELHAALGLRQLEYQPDWQMHRLQTAAWFDTHLAHPTLQPRFQHPNSTPNPFSYPLQITPEAPYTRNELQTHLHEAGIETRPIMTGNITRHPWYKNHPHAYRVDNSLTRTNAIHTHGFLIPCGPHLTPTDLERIQAAFDEFLTRKTGVGL